MSQRLIKLAQAGTLVELRGFNPDGEEENPEGTGSTSDEGGNAGSEGQGSENDGGATGSEDDSELKKVTERMKAADRQNAELRQKLQAIEDEKLSETEKKDKELETLRASHSELEASVSRLRLENAFLASNDVSWHDPEIAMSKANLEGVVDDDGNIDRKALTKSLKKLAEEKPFLVKTAETTEEKPPAGSSGSNVGGSPKDKGGKIDAERLRSRYPNL